MASKTQEPRKSTEGRLALLKRKSGQLQRHAILMALIALVAVASIGVDRFATPGNVVNILLAVAFTGTVAVGMTFVILGGYFADLSVPSTVAASALITLSLLESVNPVAAALVGILSGFIIGALNGLLVGFVNGNPIVVTLGSMTLVQGIILAMTDGAYVYSASPQFAAMGRSSIGPIPFPVLVFLLTVGIGHVILSRTRWGYWFYAAGANRSAARAAGLPTRALGLASFVLSGVSASIAGVMLASHSTQANVSLGTGYEFAAIAAVAVGGTSLFGGSGSVLRTLLGVLLVGVIDNVLILQGLAFEARLLVTGLVIVFAVGLDALMRRDSN